MNNPCEGCTGYFDDGGECRYAEPGSCDKWQWYHAGLAECKTQDVMEICKAVCSEENQPHQWMGHPEELYQHWKGLAEAESRVKAREREIVEWVRSNPFFQEMGLRNDIADRLEAWLQGKE